MTRFFCAYLRIMFTSASLALTQILSPPFRTVLWKSLGLTLALLLAVWIGVQALLGLFLIVPYPWLETGIAIASGIGLLIGMAFLIAPVTSLFAGLFLDEIAKVVEEENYPGDAMGQPQPLLLSLALTAKFTLTVIVVNLVALPLSLFLGFGFLIFLCANAYLLSREYFELAALRFHSPGDVQKLRKANGFLLFLCGLIIAGFMLIPLLNLLTPLFATAFMVHMQKQISARGNRRAEAYSTG